MERVLEQVLDPQQHLGLFEWFGHEVLGAGGQRSLLGRVGAVRGQDDDRNE